MSKEVGAGGRFDIFLDSVAYIALSLTFFSVNSLKPHC